MKAYITHDFKTPRLDGSRRLPRTFMLVPILFYISLIAGAYLSITSYMSYRSAAQRRDHYKQLTAQQDGDRSKTEKDIANINKEKLKAEKLVQWVEGTRMIQPISVAVTRSVPPEVSLNDMTFERSADIPAQINLSVRIISGSTEDIGRIQHSFETLKYRAYNSQQTKTGELLDYRTMLVWQQH